MKKKALISIEEQLYRAGIWERPKPLMVELWRDGGIRARFISPELEVLPNGDWFCHIKDDPYVVGRSS